MSDVPVTGVNPSSVAGDGKLSAEQYFRMHYGYEAWLLDIPEVRAALLPVLDRQGDSTQVQSAIENTTWWRTTTDAQRQFQDLEARNPQTAQDQITRAKNQLQQRASKIGFSIDVHRLDQMARDAVSFGWDSYTYDSAISSEAQSSISRPIAGGNVAASVAQVRELASRYFMQLDDPTAMSYGRAIANGTNSIQGVQAIFVDQQSKNRPELATQLAGGATMDDIFSTHRQQIAATLEMDPSTVDFATNPTWQRVVDFVPPGESARRAMTVPEALAYARSQPAFRYTDQARQTVATMENNLLQTWGKK